MRLVKLCYWKELEYATGVDKSDLDAKKILMLWKLKLIK